MAYSVIIWVVSALLVKLSINRLQDIIKNAEECVNLKSNIIFIGIISVLLIILCIIAGIYTIYSLLNGGK